MRFFCDGYVSDVLASSYTRGILRFSVRRFFARKNRYFSSCPVLRPAFHQPQRFTELKLY